MKNRGFTLVEIMIVVAIIGLLAAVGIPSVLTAYTNSKQTAKERNIVDVEKAKAMLVLPPDVYDGGINAEDGQALYDAQVFNCMQGVSSKVELDVGGDRIIINPIGTRATYPNM